MSARGAVHIMVCDETNRMRPDRARKHASAFQRPDKRICIPLAAQVEDDDVALHRVQVE